jgi:hypothetical protein
MHRIPKIKLNFDQRRIIERSVESAAHLARVQKAQRDTIKIALGIKQKTEE